MIEQHWRSVKTSMPEAVIECEQRCARSPSSGGLADGKQCAFGSGDISAPLPLGNRIELRIAREQQRRNLDEFAFNQVAQLCCVRNGLGLVVIVQNDVGVFRAGSDGVDALLPFREFFRSVEIVVPLLYAAFFSEPCFIVATMQAHVPDRRGDLSRRRERASDPRLVNIAEAGPILAQQLLSFWVN